MKDFVSAPTSRFRLRAVRPFKALDDGVRKKWVVVVAGRDLPVNLPLDANARVPNILKNPTCIEMRQTLLKNPELFQVFNGGVVCTASSVEVRQEGNEHIVEVGFSEDSEQGIVNGGHTYATLIHALHGDTVYSEGKDLKTVLGHDVRRGCDDLLDLATDDNKLAESIARARERAQVQIEFVSPVVDADLLAKIARARNLSQGVEATALANLAGKFDLMKQVLSEAQAPFGPSFVERVVWKTNQEVPEDSRAIPVKTLIHIEAMMNNRLYPPASKVCNEIYSRSGVVIREFSEAEGDDEKHYQALTRLLPQLIRLYDHIYTALPEVDLNFPWADGKIDAERKRKRPAAFTPLLALPCQSKVVNAFVWPVYSAFRTVLVDDAEGIRFRADPIALFEDLKSELATSVMSFHRNNAHGVVHQVGKDKELWLRLQERVERELVIRDRLAERELPDERPATEQEEELLRRIFREESPTNVDTADGRLSEQTRRVLATLTPREEQILRMRFGVGQKTDYTLEEVGKQFGISGERVRQIEAKALRKMGQTGRSKNLERFMGPEPE